MKPLGEELMTLLREDIEKNIEETLLKGLDLKAWVKRIREEHPEYKDCEIWFSQLTFEMVAQTPDFPNGKPVEYLYDNLDRITKEFNRHTHPSVGTYSGPYGPPVAVPALLKSKAVKKV